MCVGFACAYLLRLSSFSSVHFSKCPLALIPYSVHYTPAQESLLPERGEEPSNLPGSCSRHLGLLVVWGEHKWIRNIEYRSTSHYKCHWVQYQQYCCTFTLVPKYFCGTWLNLCSTSASWTVPSTSWWCHCLSSHWVSGRDIGPHSSRGC